MQIHYKGAAMQIHYIRGSNKMKLHRIVVWNFISKF